MRSTLSNVTVLLLLAMPACKHEPAPPVAAPPPSATASAPPASVSPSRAPVPSPFDDGPPRRVTKADASVAALEAVPGLGTCTHDTECELTTYQEGCCVQGCIPYASSHKALAVRRASENCNAHRGPCPPPAPCAKRTHTYESAACQQGKCVALRRPL